MTEDELEPTLGLSHWGMFKLSVEESEAVARVVLAGEAALWKSDDSGWLDPYDTALVD